MHSPRSSSTILTIPVADSKAAPGIAKIAGLNLHLIHAAGFSGRIGLPRIIESCGETDSDAANQTTAA
jgi:hypothetical protein